MSRARTWAVVAVGFGLILWAIWSANREAQLILSAAAAAWIVGSTLASRRTTRQLGIGPHGFNGACRALTIAVIAAAVIVIAGWIAGSLHPLYGVRPRGIHWFGYAIWALMQQFILNGFFYVTFEELLGDNWKAVALTCVLFACAHIPNPFLVPATLLGACFFVEMFRRHRNIYPLAISHAMLGLAIAMSAPDSVLHHMRVGIGYLNYK